jgi:hypothetical protein
LALKKPPPLVPSILIAICEATGPCAIVCFAPGASAALAGWEPPGQDDVPDLGCPQLHIIDGDARLHVGLTSRSAGGQIVREILHDQANAPVLDQETFTYTSAGDIDIAVYADVSANFQISLVTDPVTGEILFGTDGNPVLQVTHIPPAGVADEGTDTLYNIERLRFADVTIENPFAQFVSDLVAQGALTIDNPAPNAGDTVSILASTVNDFEGVLVNGVLDAATAGFERIDIPLNELSLQWQYLDPVAVGGNPPQWVNIAGATGTSFVVPEFFVGVPLAFFVPYFERPCLRLATPWASSVPRTIW